MHSKRLRDEDTLPDLSETSPNELELGPPPAKHPRITLTSDFSTFEIGRALDASPTLMQLPTARPDTSTINPGRSAEPTAEDEASSGHDPSEGISDNSADIWDLLNFSNLDSVAAIEARFGRIASELLHNYRIEIKSAIGTEQLEILEAEFYLWKTDCHEDPFTHASPEQSQCGRW